MYSVVMYSCNNMKSMFARVSLCFPRDSTGVLIFLMIINLQTESVTRLSDAFWHVRSYNKNRDGRRNTGTSLFLIYL